MRHGLSRRNLLLGTACGAGLLPLAVPSRARAFSTEDIVPGSGLGIAYANRCGSDAEHAAIRADLEQRLAAQPGAPGAAATISAVCPICGCPVYASRVSP
jgi:hypothetical protein